EKQFKCSLERPRPQRWIASFGVRRDQRESAGVAVTHTDEFFALKYRVRYSSRDSPANCRGALSSGTCRETRAASAVRSAGGSISCRLLVACVRLCGDCTGSTHARCCPSVSVHRTRREPRDQT